MKKSPEGLRTKLTPTSFIFFGRDSGLWTVSIGLTVTEAKSGPLRDWVQRTFGAQDIAELQHLPGQATKAVWRPGLYFDDEMLAALDATSYDLRLAEQALLLLIQRLDELLHYVEPTPASLSAHSHKSRELLILACTEAENYLGSMLRIAGATLPRRGFTTNDYVKLLGPLQLTEFVVSLPRYAAVLPTAPFGGWSSAAPTQSLSWYDAYNKTKHDRATHFSVASLETCICAVMANVVLFAVRFGPFRLFNGAGTLPAYFNQIFSLELHNCDPASFYVPLVSLPANQRQDLVCYGARDSVQPWVSNPLVLWAGEAGGCDRAFRPTFRFQIAPDRTATIFA